MHARRCPHAQRTRLFQSQSVRPFGTGRPRPRGARPGVVHGLVRSGYGELDEVSVATHFWVERVRAGSNSLFAVPRGTWPAILQGKSLTSKLRDR